MNKLTEIQLNKVPAKYKNSKLTINVCLTKTEKNNQYKIFDNIINSKTEKELTEHEESFSWKIFSYWKLNWSNIIANFVFWLRPAKLDVFLDTNNVIEAFFSRLKKRIKKENTIDKFFYELKVFLEYEKICTNIKPSFHCKK